MKRIATLTLLVSLLAASSAFARLEGSWTATPDEKNPSRLYMNLTHRHHYNNGSTMNVADFAGLTDATIHAATQTPVQFQLRREAGDVTFDGSFRNGNGAGQFAFTGNRDYVAKLRALGVDVDLRKHRFEDDDENVSEEETLFTLALLDVSTDYIKSMRAVGYDVSLEKYTSMRIFRVTPELMRELGSLGFRNIDADNLVATRIHGVTPDYIRQMRAAGWNLSLDELVASRIHGATPEFAAEMKKLGYGDVSHERLVEFRIHGVSPSFISELRDLGYDHIPADKLVEMRIFRVTPEFIRELAKAGYKKVPVEKLVEMRMHGIDAKFLDKMSKVQ
jgi:hypothetical protein